MSSIHSSVICASSIDFFQSIFKKFFFHLQMTYNFVTKSKGFAVWGALFKKEMWLLQGSFIKLQQVKEIKNSYPKPCLPEGGLSYCLCTLFGQICLFLLCSWVHLQVGFLSSLSYL